jgi:ketosteroid isomerase-like protein
MMMENPNIKIVEGYLDAIRSKDLSKAPVDQDIQYEDPLTTPGSGIKAWSDFVSSMLPALSDVRVKQHIAEGDHVATLWEAVTIWGVIPIFECFRISEGRIKEARAFFDPRPITNATGK